MANQAWELLCFQCMRALEQPGTVCPHCGYDNSRRLNPTGYLPETVLKGQYYVGKALGRGGFGITYAGYDFNLRLRVAIKEYFPTTLATRDGTSSQVVPYNDSVEQFAHGQQRALDEGRLIANIGHVPNAVQVYNVFRDNGTVYIIMEYIEGVTLTKIVKEQGKLPWEEALRLLYPIMKALERVHARGVIHRDISPDNIMYNQATDETMLLDFGAARSYLDQKEGLTETWRPGFGPIEQYSASSKQDGRADEYGICATMYYLITGTYPDSADRRRDGGSHMLTPRELGADIPERMEAILLKGMSVQADDRYGSMRELREAFEGAPPPTPQPPKRNRKGLLAVIAAIVVALAVAGVWFATHRGGQEDPLMDDALPTQEMTDAPTTSQPTEVILTEAPTDVPTAEPTKVPTQKPTEVPTAEPTEEPTDEPTQAPTDTPVPTEIPADWGIMMDDVPSFLSQNGGSAGQAYVLWNRAVTRDEVTKIEFKSTLKDKPEGAWDVSYNANGSVWAWMTRDGSNYQLTIAAEGGVKLNSNARGLFAGYTNLTGIVFGRAVDASQVTDMSSMFEGCSSLQRVLTSELDTSNVTDMSGMFSGCSSLKDISLLTLDTKNVTNAARMFGDCAALQKVTVKKSFLKNADTTDIFLGASVQSVTYNPLKWPIMMEDALTDFDCGNIEDGYTGYVLGSEISRAAIGTVSFMDDTSGKPEDAWDVSYRHDGTVWAWVTEGSYIDNNGQKLLDLTIAGDEGIRFPTDSGFLFRAYINLREIHFNDCISTAYVRYFSSMFEDCFSLTSLDLSCFDTTYVTRMDYMFAEANSLTSLDVSSFNTAQVWDMPGMFRNCYSLTELDVSNFDTSNVRGMGQMFDSCSSLTRLDVSNFDTANVGDMYRMFGNCSNLTSLDLSSFDTANVEEFGFAVMFEGCSSLTSLDLSNFNTSKAKDMNNMFWGCSGLTKLDVSHFDTSNVTDMCGMFNGCTSLTELNLRNFNTSRVTNMAWMFVDYLGTELDLSSFDTSSVEDMCGMFNGCINITGYDLSNFNTSRVTNMNWMFGSNRSLTSLDLSSFDTSNVTEMMYMFDYCEKLRELQVGPGFGEGADTTGMYDNCPTKSGTLSSAFWPLLKVDRMEILPEQIEQEYTGYVLGSLIPRSTIGAIEFRNDTSNVPEGAWDVSDAQDGSVMAWVSMGSYTNDRGEKLYNLVIAGRGGLRLPVDSGNLFRAYTNVRKITFGDSVSTRDVTDMSGMFSYCYRLESLDLSGFDTSKVENMTSMFEQARSIKSLDLTSFNTSRVAIMFGMFDGCEKMTSVNLSSFDTSNVWQTTNMFRGCTSLGKLDLSNFNTSNVTDMNEMFNGCKNLTSLNVSSFDTSKVEWLYEMFRECSRLTSLDVSGFNTSSAVTMERMFENCSGLMSLDLSGFNTPRVESMRAMFRDCSNLTSLNVSGLNLLNCVNVGEMFANCSKLKSIDVSKFNTSKVEWFDTMFEGCKSLTSLDLSGFNTSNAISLCGMFYQCSSLVELDLSNFNTSKVQDVRDMFGYCSRLTSLNVSSFDTSRMELMDGMFMMCSSLTSLDVSGFNTSSATSMQWMFQNCSKLTSLDLSGFDTSHVENMGWMFYGCSSLTELNLKSFNSAALQTAESMFTGCNKLKTVTVTRNFQLDDNIQFSNTPIRTFSNFTVVD